MSDPEHYGYLVEGWSGEDKEDESMCTSNVEAAQDISTFFRRGCDIVKIRRLYTGPTESYRTLEDAMGTFKL